MTIDPDLLRPLPAFASLSARDRRRVAAAASLRTLPAEGRAFVQGEPANEVFLVLSGRLKLVRRGWARESVILRIVHPGELFDLGRGTHGHRHGTTASALRDATLAVWPAPCWQRLVQEMPPMALALVQLLEHGLADAQDRFVEIASLDVSRRIGHSVLRLIDQAGREEAGGVRIDFPITRQDLAGLTGTTLHNVSRILTRWERQGVIAGGRRTLMVRDIPALMRLANGADAGLAD